MRRVMYMSAEGILVLVVGGWIWLALPFLKLTRTRIDEHPVEVVATFSNETCELLSTKLYAAADGHASNEPILPMVAADIPDPSVDTDLKDGDRIRLEGYGYEWRETSNRLARAFPQRQS